MRPVLLALALAMPLPGAAQAPGPVPPAPPARMEEGLRLFLDGLREELEPGLRGLGALAEEAAPLLRDLQDRLGGVVEDLDAYEAPEILPNGDILIRRRTPLGGPPPDAPGAGPEVAPPEIAPNPDGTLDL